MKRQLHLNLFIQSRGHHEASWRHPDSSPLALTDIEYFRDLARRAEGGLFDSIFLADQLALADTVAHAASTWLEPITALAAIAGSTRLFESGLKSGKHAPPQDPVAGLRAWATVHGLATLAIDGMLPQYDPVMLARALAKLPLKPA